MRRRTGSLVGRTARVGAALVMAAGTLTGCVSQRDYDELYEANRSLESRNRQLLNDNQALEARISGLGASNTGAEVTIGELRQANARLRDQLGSAANTIATMEDRLSNMSFGRVDPTTDLALQNLASQYPDLIIYDADRGMLRFASDLTFASGSDQVQSSATDSLAALARVLNEQEAQAYDIKIIGHTDSQKISAGTQQRHPTNMHLAAHRAISVRSALGRGGVEWSRMYVAGWGEHRPLVPNSATGGTQQNRRVEVFLVPSTTDSTHGGGGETRADTDPDAPSSRVFDPTK